MSKRLTVGKPDFLKSDPFSKGPSNQDHNILRSVLGFPYLGKGM